MIEFFFYSNYPSLSESGGAKAKRTRTKLKLTPQLTSDPRVVTQEKIIERIRNASCSLDFKETRWRSVSESAKQLLRGLLNVDPRKRMKLKDLSRHQWIRNGGEAKHQQSGAFPPTATQMDAKRAASEAQVVTCRDG